VQLEIDRKPDTACSSADHQALPHVDVGDDVIKHLFQGELISEVRPRAFLQLVMSVL